MHPDDLYRSVGPSVSGPMPLVLLTDGWIEASDTIARIRETIMTQADLTTIAEFDTDQLLDQRARRPTMRVVDGLMEGVSWPSLELSVGTDGDQTPFMLLHGPEPDFRWRPFAKAVSTLAASVGVTTAYTMGAYPAPMPHTRALRISTTATNSDVLTGRDFSEGTIDVPIGIFAAVAEELRASGTESIGLWAQVPYYLSTTAVPQASIAVLDNLGRVSGLTFDTSALEAKVAESTAEIDEIMQSTPALESVVRSLEERFDEFERLESKSRDESSLSTGDQLEQQVQQYLRNIEGE